MRKRNIITGALLLALLLGACGEKIEPGHTAKEPGEAVKASVATVSPTTQPLYYEATGTIRAQTASTLTAKIMGAVREIRTAEGKQVKKDQVLAVIDPRQVEAGLSQAQAGLEEAQRSVTAAISAKETAAAQAALAQSTFNRYRTLMEKESVSRQEFDEVKARHLQAQAAVAQADAMVSAARSRVRQAKAALVSGQVSQSDATIVAPYDGLITRKHIDVGDLAVPGTPLFEIEAGGEGFRVDLLVPENHITAVTPGNTLAIVVPALKEPALEAQVRTVIPFSNPRTRSFTVQAMLPDNIDGVRSGMFARARIPVGTATLIFLPASAIVRQGQLTGLFVVDETQTARFRLVRTGKVVDDQVEVISGLSEGIRFVTQPPPGSDRWDDSWRPHHENQAWTGRPYRRPFYQFQTDAAVNHHLHIVRYCGSDCPAPGRRASDYRSHDRCHGPDARRQQRGGSQPGDGSHGKIALGSPRRRVCLLHLEPRRIHGHRALFRRRG